ncbi:MAG: hypothetical protein ABSC51_01085 [Gaiellaceae bacterium]|jgi:hypothetical protein
MTTLTLKRLDRRNAWIAGGALAGSLAMQLAVFAAAVLKLNPTPDNGTSSVLLSRQHHLSDVLVIAGTNLAWLMAIAMLAWPIARLWSWGIHDTWDHPNVNIAARVLYPLVAICLLGTLFWVFSRQVQMLDDRLLSHWALLAMLPHGTLEFGALLLPLVAATSCIFVPAREPGRLLVRTLALAVPLLVCAALLEVYLAPRLLIPLKA